MEDQNNIKNTIQRIEDLLAELPSVANVERNFEFDVATRPENFSFTLYGENGYYKLIFPFEFVDDLSNIKDAVMGSFLTSYIYASGIVPDERKIAYLYTHTGITAIQEIINPPPK